MNRTISMLAAILAASTILAQSGALAADLAAKKAKTLAEAVAVPPTVLPAVSGINGSIEAAGGYVNGSSPLGAGGYGHLGGSLSLPLAQQFGVQADGLAATVDGISLLGAGAHAFWRDPAKGLLGVYGEGLTADVGSDRLNKGRIGAEAEYYMERMTFSGIAGYEWGNLHIRNGLFAEVLVGYFATDDLKLSAGYSYGFAGNMGLARVDWQLPSSTGLNGVSLFVEGRVGEGDYKAVLAGVKIPFGVAPKSLKAHERQDDPPMWLKSQPHAVASAKAQGDFTPKGQTVCESLTSQYNQILADWNRGGVYNSFYGQVIPLLSALVDQSDVAGCGLDLPRG
jgi:hypothetical protein